MGPPRPILEGMDITRAKRRLQQAEQRMDWAELMMGRVGRDKWMPLVARLQDEYTAALADFRDEEADVATPEDGKRMCHRPNLRA